MSGFLSEAPEREMSEHTRERRDMRDQLLFLRKAAETERFHSVRTIQHETVGHHSFGVAWICFLLSPTMPRVNLILAALGHDIAEHEAGDLPAPTKRALNIRAMFHNYEMKLIHEAGLIFDWSLSEAEERILKLADAFDGFMSCIREREMGNKIVRNAAGNFQRYIHELKPQGVELIMADVMAQLWREAEAA